MTVYVLSDPHQCFFFFAIVAIDPNSSTNYGYQWGGIEKCQVDHNVAFTLPVLSLVVITILNDGTIITIAYDKVIPDTKPQKWDMIEVGVPLQLGAAVVLALPYAQW